MTAVPALDQLRFPIHYLEVTEALVRSRGGRVGDVRAACGLPAAGAPQQPAWIDGRQMLQSAGIAHQHCLPDEPPSLQILRHFPLSAHGTLGMLAMTQATLGEALDLALQYHAMVMPLFEFRRQPDTAEGAHVRVVPVLDLGPFAEVMAEVVIGALANVKPYVAGQEPVLRAQFAHAAQWPPEAYASFFGIAPVFDAPWHGFTVPRALLAAPLITGNRATSAQLEGLLLREAPGGVQARPLTHRVRQSVLAGLRKGKVPTGESVAFELAMSVRTLSRRLQDEQQTLGAIVEHVRMEYAELLLRDGPDTVEAVARLAGFANASSFTRAFKRATGFTPAELRERLRGR
ncbi:MAG: AraC family transcriptional regulator [Aquabacterium sp.]|nr:MAG: AraC family transcriptional regulator [Aquabacterium sp.]